MHVRGEFWRVFASAFVAQIGVELLQNCLISLRNGIETAQVADALVPLNSEVDRVELFYTLIAVLDNLVDED